ncbi:hypothetical protein BDV93DRAFT_612240 [Ceratobasidium sp. AG-I]|nr:hypothetical protein BDV93DRAFT_612240 [Ceratobasidium sp. AG-I]
MPTHITVLPKGAQESLLKSPASPQPLRLPHPRTGLPALFLPCSDSILELHSVSPDATRSWFVGQSVVSDGKILLMTPVDPAFLLIPLLREALSREPQHPYKPTDDLTDEIIARRSSDDQSDIRTFMGLDCVRRALRVLCETKDISPDVTVHRPSDERMLAFLRRRVERVLLAQKPQEPASDPVLEQPSTDPETSTTDLVVAAVSEVTTPGPVFPTIHRQHLRLGLSTTELGPDTDLTALAIRAAARIKTACEIVGTWVEEGLMNELMESYDLSAYTAHAALRVEQARAELATATARAEAAEAGKSKKGKGAAEKRKAGAQGTRGVDKLKKANTKGMSALTSFFGKKE